MPNAHFSGPGAAAFDALFERHQRRILAYAIRRTTTVSDAEDVAADTFAVAWRRRADIPADELPWLYGVARRILANHRRARERRVRLWDRIAAADPRPQGGHAPEAQPALAAMARLRPDDQELLALVAWEELTHAQIAEVLAVSPNAVAIRLHRARARFAAELGRVPEQHVKGSATARTHRSVRGRITGRLRREETR